jgi:hypothetical protein
MNAKQQLLVSRRDKHGVIEHVKSAAPEYRSIEMVPNAQERVVHAHSLTGSKFILSILNIT